MGFKHNFVDLSTCTSRRKNQRVNFYEQKIPSLMDGEDGIPARALGQSTPLDLQLDVERNPDIFRMISFIWHLKT